jgi:2-methylaconitate cis-trans-isomerase PrpF
MEEMLRIPIVIYRGGTSKGIFIKEIDLPGDPTLRDNVICALFGSPDKRQIDGLGGADPLTSKVAIIGPPSRPDAHIDYLFGQVDILTRRVRYGGVCGNISSAVGPYAIDEGFVRGQEPITSIRIYCKSKGRILEARVPVQDKKVKVSGDYSIDGVPGTGARIELNWSDLVGANTGSLLPTGNLQDKLTVPGLGTFTVSIVDVGNAGVFIRAEELGLTGEERPQDLDPNLDLIKKCEGIAEAAGKRIGGSVHLTYVSSPRRYVNHITGKEVAPEEVDFLARMIFMGKMHKTYAASQIACCGIAAVIPGTLVHEVASCSLENPEKVRIGHPGGAAELLVTRELKSDQISFPRITVGRTARRLMEGYAYVKREVMEGSRGGPRIE